MTPVVPPKANRKDLRDLDKDICKLRNKVERMFRRLEHFRRIYTRYDKLDMMFAGFLKFALVVDMI